MIGKHRPEESSIAVVLPDGVGVRNFVLGEFLNCASQHGHIHALHRIPEGALESYTSHTNGHVTWRPMLSTHEGPVPLILRQGLGLAQRYWVDNFPMRQARTRPIVGSWKSQTRERVVRMIGRVAASPRRMQWLESAHSFVARRSTGVSDYQRLLEQIRPSVVFCSNHRPSSLIPPVLAAKSLGIPTATFIYSWDNLSSKERIATPFDHYLVWSENMREELLRFYPHVREHQAHVIGAPQFDPYGDDRLLWSREEFFQRIGADPGRQLICFSGGDVGNSLEDHHHVRLLMELIASGKIRNRPQVILRPAPVDEGSRYDAVRRDYPELIYAPPEWMNANSSDWSIVMPLPGDVRFLANLTKYVDVNINFASTMTLDFALRDKPVINIVVDTQHPLSYGIPMWDHVRQYEHYHPVIELKAARFPRTADELARDVNDYLEDPSLDREGRRRFAELEVGAPVGQSYQRIVEVLTQIQRSR